MSEIFADAHIQAATMSTVLMHSEFNQNDFTDSDFSAASTTDIPLTNDEPETASPTAEIQQPLSPPPEEIPLEPVLPAISTHLHQKTTISEPQPGPSMQDENSVFRSPIRRPVLALGMKVGLCVSATDQLD
ncbi:hypothetical protein JTB14_031001 [Gonioctena quinquepunctata]|nr:hypothetical protein JTB14_031001 [Gonioctena quinquepunctata]